ASRGGARMDRRRPRARPRLPLRGSGRPPVRALLRDRALRRARKPPPGAQEPAAALRAARRGREAARPRQPARLRRRRLPRVRAVHARLPAVRAGGAGRGTEAGAWLSLTIAAHELIYVLD